MITAVAVLAAPDRRRLDVSAAGCKTIAASLQAQHPEKDSAVHVELGSTGHGKDGLGYRLARLVAQGPVHLHDGSTVTTPAQASAVARAWAPSLNSRRIRDTMHLVMSAKAGTDVESFRATARAFLGETFEGHRYLFALHQDRDHVHAHAVITMRAESGQKLDPKIQISRAGVRATPNMRALMASIWWQPADWRGLPRRRLSSATCISSKTPRCGVRRRLRGRWRGSRPSGTM